MRKRIAGLAACLALAGGGEVSMAVERPAYQLELSATPFELREYPPLLHATVRVDGSRDAAVNAGFRILAAYIFGGNKASEKIAMTAPVLQAPADSAAPGAAETAPQAAEWNVTFIMPASYRLEALPAANDPRIHFAEAPASRMAVVTFSGFWSEANLRSHQAQLERFIADHHLRPIAGPVYAFYDPPWVPWFMRTNEVQYQVAPIP